MHSTMFQDRCSVIASVHGQLDFGRKIDIKKLIDECAQLSGRGIQKDV